MTRLLLFLVLLLCLPHWAQAAIPTETTASFPIPDGITGWFNAGAGMGTDGQVFDNRMAQMITPSSSGELNRVNFSGYRPANTTAPLRINVTRVTNGQPGEVLGTTTIDAAAVPTQQDGPPTMNLTAQFTGPGPVLQQGETYFLVFLSDTTEANYRLYGSGSGSGRFKSQNGAPYTPSSGLLFYEVIVFSNRAPTPVDDVVFTRGGAVTFDPLANDSDAEHEDLSITLVSSPDRGRVFIEGNQLRYVSDRPLTDSDTFSYFVSDPHGLTATAVVDIVNPFSAITGLAEATIKSADRPVGRLALKISPRGQVTGTLTINGKKYTFKRTLELDGTLSTTLTAPRRDPVTLELASDNGPSPTFTGTITVGGETYDIALGGVLVTKLAEPFKGAYTFRLPGNTTGTNPRGTGYATGTLTPNGMLKLRGRLQDFTPFTAAVPFQSGGALVVTVPLYQGGGYLHGVLLWSQNPEPQIAGNLTLKRPAQSGSVLFPEGFEMTTFVAGDRYYLPARGESVIDATSATLVLLPGEVEIAVNVNSRDVVRATDPANPQKLTLTLNRSTGKFSGKTLISTDTEPTRFEGVWKWDSGYGQGLFLRNNQTAPVIFGSPDRFPANPGL